MSKEKRRVPKLRFPGFTEDWEQRKLGEYANFRRGSFPQPYGNKEWYDGVGSAPFVQVVDVGDNLSLVDCTKQRISKLAQPMSVYAEKGSVLVTLQGSIGRVAVSQYDAFIDRTILIFQGYKYKTNSYFWAYIIKNKFSEEALKAPGGTIKTITKEALSNFIILYPKFSEQEQIGSFFEKLDKLITLHQRKLDNLKLKKKALLQKLFPKNGERYPELRFPGFTDAWEQCKLGSIGSTYTGLSGKTKEDFGHGEAQYITYLNVFQNTVSDITMTDKVEIDTTQNEVKYGDVLFTTSSETPEEVGMSSVWLGHTPNIYLNSFCFGFRPNQKIDPYFLGYSLRAPYMRDKIKILAQGISRYNISKNKVMELEISLPNNEEQSLLGIFLRNIDLDITLHQQEPFLCRNSVNGGVELC